MPLLKGRKNISKNIKTEMEHGKPQKQSIAIAMQVARKPKKMAKGGAISASDEKRPMPEEMDNDSAMVHKNSGKKSLPESSMTSRPDIAQSQRGPKNPQKIKHPKIASSGAFQVKLRDQEDDLQESASVNDGPQRQPPEMYDEEGADRQGPDVPALHMKRMAKGGEIDIMEEDYTDKPDKGFGAIIFKAEGGEIEDSEMQPEPEAEEERHASLAAAVMAKRRKAAAGADSDSDIEQMLAEGGSVGPGSDMADIEHENNVEHPNGYYYRNEDAALKENYDEDMLDVSQPMDSNMHGDDLDSDKHDHIDMIRRKMKMKRG